MRIRAILLAVALFGVSGCTSDDAAAPPPTVSTPPDTAAPATLPPTAATLSPLVTAAATTAPTAAPPTAAATSGPPELTGIIRPYVDPTLCEPVAAYEGTWTSEPLEPFAMWTDAPIAMQVIAKPDLGPTGPFALVLRYRDRPLDLTGRELFDVDDLRIAVQIMSSGNVQAMWDLPDGGQAYVRARDIDRATLLAIVGAVTPRDPGAAIPGFDVGMIDTPLGLELVAEDMNSGFAGSGSSIECTSPDDAQLHWWVTSIDADPVAEYVTVLDRPRPMDVGTVDGSLVMITGPLAFAADPLITLDDVTNADQATWDALLVDPAG